MSDDDMSEEYRRIGKQLRLALLATCPHDLMNSIDDLVQEALIRVMNLLRRGEGPRRFNASYMKRVANSVLIDEIRKRRRKREELLENGEGGVPLRSGSPSPEQVVADSEIGKEIQECLGRLVENRRRAVTLYLLGHRVRETGRLLDWTRKKAENLVFRGMADLRNCLKEKGVSP